MENIKHPYFDCDLQRALNLGRNIVYGPLPKPDAPIPTLDEALAAIQQVRETCGFNWITGRVATEVLRAAKGEANPFST